MNKEFIPYEQELEMKDLGFIAEPIVDSWRSLTLYQQAFRWFRENHGLYTEFFISDDKTFAYMITSFIEEGRLDRPIRWGFITYEDAEFDCLKKLIELVKQKQLLIDIMEADHKDGLYDNENEGGNK